MLSRGRTRDQPMLTLSGSASHAEESRRTRDVTAHLRADGFDPVRVGAERLVRAATPAFEGTGA
ncbi:hypothetical protein ABZ281_11870 [Streptomyces sp. NPDC006265]|uniref:hypothetical protein n=1 Tax=Streptomyces sp. NPDC006265 TaxID=3156740 RepID=UPI0033AEFC76